MSLSEYTHEHFHSLPTIEQAGARFVSIDGQQLVHGLLRDLFVNRGMDSTFGLCLMHRHAELETTERLVHYHETASPWKDFTGLPVKPVMWSTSTDGSIRPTEFRYSSQQELVFDEKITSFIEEFNSLAGRNDASGLFGLVEHPGDHFETTCEITQGRTNINLLLADLPAETPIIDTAWFFSPKLYQRGCKCACKEKTGGGHDHDYHYTTLRD